MTPFELFILELVRMAPIPLYSMYAGLAAELRCVDLSMPRFFDLVDGMLDGGAVELWRPVGGGRMEQLSRVPDDLEDDYTATELDPTWDPFGLELRLGPHAPEGEDPDWDVDVDLASRTFTLYGPDGAIPENLGDALSLLAPYRFEAVRRTREGDEVRVEGVVVGGPD